MEGSLREVEDSRMEDRGMEDPRMEDLGMLSRFDVLLFILLTTLDPLSTKVFVWALNDCSELHV